LIHRPSAQSGRGAFLFPIENNRWHVGLNGVHGETPPDDVQDFIAFASTLRTPTIYDAIKDATAAGPIYRFGLPCSVRRRFEALSNFPGRLLPLGDVICRFNPAFGQGMSVVAQEVAVLKLLLDARAGAAGPLDGLAQAFFAAIQDVLAAPWSVAEYDFIYSKTRGECPANFQQRLKYSNALQQIAAEDAAVHRIMAEVNNLVKPPSALRDPQIANRVTALMAASA
jgi:2-polyprenyl-6-methoxyphenol hydroxylase-like FAD-dependent oxidoreductase